MKEKIGKKGIIRRLFSTVIAVAMLVSSVSYTTAFAAADFDEDAVQWKSSEMGGVKVWYVDDPRYVMAMDNSEWGGSIEIMCRAEGCGKGHFMYDRGMFMEQNTCEHIRTDDPTDPNRVRKVTLDKSDVTMKTGDNVTLTATIIPDYATNKEVTWSSSNAKIATVDNGAV